MICKLYLNNSLLANVTHYFKRYKKCLYALGHVTMNQHHKHLISIYLTLILFKLWTYLTLKVINYSFINYNFIN